MNRILRLLSLILLPSGLFSQGVITVSPDLELIKISENAYVHVSYTSSPDFGRYSSNGLIFINGREALLFDTPSTDSLTGILLSWLTENMNLEIKGFVPNHWHEDCMGGLACLRQIGVKTFANQLTIDIAAEKHLPLPEIGFVDSLTLHLGNRKVFCWFPGAAHSKDNIVVWIPSEKILFPGCMIKSIDAGNLGNVADGDLKEYPVTIGKLIEKFSSARIVIPGHGAVGGFGLLTHTLSLAGN